MGRKFPIDTEFQPLVLKGDSIYASENSSGYKINVNHPRIKPLFEAYHKHVGVPLHIHLSHAQRMEFEMMVLRLIEKKRSMENVQQSDSDGSSDT